MPQSNIPLANDAQQQEIEALQGEVAELKNAIKQLQQLQQPAKQ